MRWKRWISVTPLAMIAVAPVVTSLASPTTALAADDTDAITRLSGIVNATSGVSADDREAAAVQLLSRDAPAARAAVLAAIKNNANPIAQTAVANAVAQAQHPNENLIQALGDLLGTNPALTEAAAAALVNYPGNALALQRLTKFADAQATPEPIREIVIHAMGQLIDQPAAEYLFNLATQPQQNAGLQSAALAALGDMSGLSEYGTDQKLLKQWWDSMRAKTPDQFRAALLETRAKQFNRLKRRNQVLAESARKALIDGFRALPPAAQPDVLKAYLNDPAPEVRSVGVKLVGIYLIALPPTEQVRQRLFQLIADSDEKVRSDVVDLLRNLNDPASFNALINQLGIEKDPQVAQTIAQIMGNLKNADAAPAAAKALAPMLHDPHPGSALAAAKALAGLGENVQKKDPNLANDISDQIRTLLKGLNNQPANNALRAACVSAVAELRDPKSLDTFRDCLVNPGESAEVVCAALKGIGFLGDSRANQIVLDRLDDSRPTVRLEAAHALATLATPDQDGAIFDRMNNDRDPEVSQALWIAFKALCPKMTPAQLEHWAAKFDNNPERKVVILQILGDALKRAGDAQAMAYNDQKIADAMMSVKPVPQATEAIAQLQLALDYWRGAGKGVGGSDANLETLVGQMVDDKLIAEQWAGACSFAAEQLAINGIYQPTVGQRIKDKIDELIKANDTTAAQKLIDAALAMKPPLDGKYVGMIQRSQAELNQKRPAP